MIALILASCVAVALGYTTGTGSGSAPVVSGTWTFDSSGGPAISGQPSKPQGSFNGMYYSNNPSSVSSAMVMLNGMLTSSEFFGYGSVSMYQSASGSTATTMVYYPICTRGPFSPAASGTFQASGNVGGATFAVEGKFGAYAGMTSTGAAPMMASGIYSGQFSTTGPFPDPSSFSKGSFYQQCGTISFMGSGDWSVYGSLFLPGGVSGMINIMNMPGSKSGMGTLNGPNGQMVEARVASITYKNGEFSTNGYVANRPFTGKGTYAIGGSSGYWHLHTVTPTNNKCDIVGGFYGNMPGSAQISGHFDCHKPPSTSGGTPESGLSVSVTVQSGKIYQLSVGTMGAASTGTGLGKSIGKYGNDNWSVSTTYKGVKIAAEGAYGEYGAWYATQYSAECAKQKAVKVDKNMPNSQLIAICGTQSGESINLSGYAGKETLSVQGTIVQSTSGMSPQFSGYATVGSDASFPVSGYWYSSGASIYGNVMATSANPDSITFSASLGQLGDVIYAEMGSVYRMKNPASA